MTRLESNAAGADLDRLVSHAASRFGDATALIADVAGHALSFAELDAQVDAFAIVLSGLGVGPGDTVAVMLENRVEYPLIWLALARLAAVMVPLNVFYKQADATHVVGDSSARFLIVEERFLDLGLQLQLVTEVSLVIDITQIGDLVSRAAGQAFMGTEASVGSETLVNIQYTSGTTGKPKGCLLSQGYWCQLARSNAALDPGIRHGDVLLSAQPFYYMDPQWLLASGLAVGATTVLLDRFHPSTFWAKVDEYRATYFYCLGVMPMLLLNQATNDEDSSSERPGVSLRHIICSGIPAALHESIEQRWGIPWFEGYGSTESGADIAMSRDAHDRMVGSGSIGRALPHREVRIVDESDTALARGSVGELVLRGIGMMDGYHRDPESTARVFRNGWYHTGDLAYVDDDDFIFLVGRKKEVVKRSGENISVAEVEETLLAHPAVVLVACVGVPDEIRGEELLACLVLRADAKPDAVDDLVDHCRAHLAYFKVPRYWEVFASLPLTQSGKVAKETLRTVARYPTFSMDVTVQRARQHESQENR